VAADAELSAFFGDKVIPRIQESTKNKRINLKNLNYYSYNTQEIIYSLLDK